MHTHYIPANYGLGNEMFEDHSDGRVSGGGHLWLAANTPKSGYDRGVFQTKYNRMESMSSKYSSQEQATTTTKDDSLTEAVDLRYNFANQEDLSSDVWSEVWLVVNNYQ